MIIALEIPCQYFNFVFTSSCKANLELKTGSYNYKFQKRNKHSFNQIGKYLGNWF